MISQLLRPIQDPLGIVGAFGTGNILFVCRTCNIIESRSIVLIVQQCIYTGIYIPAYSKSTSPNEVTTFGKSLCAGGGVLFFVETDSFLLEIVDQ
jgi:hypothetical protein